MIYGRLPAIVKDKEPASAYLNAVAHARKYMLGAEMAMLLCSQKAMDPKVRAHYDAIHKQMVRLRKEWNRLEQIRENISGE